MNNELIPYKEAEGMVFVGLIVGAIVGATLASMFWLYWMP
jgi:hypothetical protein